jgi:hypothetical protein
LKGVLDANTAETHVPGDRYDDRPHSIAVYSQVCDYNRDGDQAGNGLGQIGSEPEERVLADGDG